MIIGLTGYATAGKDTVGQILVDYHGFQRRAFADKLKDGVAALLGIERDQIDRYKIDPDLHVEIWAGTRDDSESISIQEMLFRVFLQRFGTEMGREVFGEDFWVDQCMPYEEFLGDKPNIVLTDVRFENEAKRVRDLGGCVWFVDRPGVESANSHASEQGLKELASTVLINDCGIPELQHRVTDTYLYEREWRENGR